MNIRRFARLTAPAVLLTTTLATPAAADGQPARTSQQVSIDAREPLDGSPATFTTLGDGLCPAGGVQSQATIALDRRRLTFDVRKTFTCADGSGSWFVKLSASVEPCDAFDSGTWMVTGGTGAYRHLRGQGQIVGLYEPTNACDGAVVVDHYRGTARFGGSS